MPDDPTDIKQELTNLTSVVQEMVRSNLMLNDTITKSNDLTAKSSSEKSKKGTSGTSKDVMDFGSGDIGEAITKNLGLSKLKSTIKKNLGETLNNAMKEPTKALEHFKKFGISTFESLKSFSKNLFANPLLIMVVLISGAIKRFQQLDKAAEDFRKEVGLAGDQTRDMERMAQRINVQYENMGVTIEGVLKSMSSLVEEFGATNVLSDQLVKNTSLFASALGISEKTSAGFTKNLSIISGMSLDTASNFEATAFNLAKTAGVAPVKVIEDMANASEDTLIAFAGMPGKLLSASIYARTLGTTINELSQTTRGLLDFQSSISAEMEASTLLGQTLNLQKARQLRFAGDIVGANEEILKRVEAIGDFNSLNVFQQEAIAKATGKSVGELQKQMILRQRAAKFGLDLAKMDERSQEALAASKDLRQEEVDQLVRQSDLRADQAKMMAELSSLGTSIAQIFVPLVTIVSSILVPALQMVGGLVRSFFKPIQEVVEQVSKMSDGLGENVDIAGSLIKAAEFIGMVLGKSVALSIKFTAQWYVIKTLFSSVSSVALGFAETFGVASSKLVSLVTRLGKVGSFLLKIGKFLPMFAKIVPVIGWVIFGVEAMVRAVKDFIDIWSSGDSIAEKLVQSFRVIPMAILNTFLSPFKMVLNWIGKMFGAENFGTMITDGISGAANWIFDALAAPFRMVWAWLDDLFFGKSPSKLGLNILKGLTAVQGMITDVLLMPFKIAQNVIGGIFDTLFGKAQQDPTQKLVESFADLSESKLSLIKDVAALLSSDQLSSNILKTAESIKSLASSINNISSDNLVSINSLSQEPKNKDVNTTKETSVPDNGAVIAKFDELIGLMRSGAIAVNLDGRRVSQQLARKVY